MKLVRLLVEFGGFTLLVGYCRGVIEVVGLFGVSGGSCLVWDLGFGLFLLGRVGFRFLGLLTLFGYLGVGRIERELGFRRGVFEVRRL